jgi:predicted O-methyltransferase YrrM
MASTDNTLCLVEGRPSRYSQLQTLIALLKPRKIVEIGTNRGDSAVAMCSEALKHRPQVHYIGYDVFETRDEEFHRRAFNGKGAFSRQFVYDRLAALGQSPSFTFELIEGETSATLHGRSVQADLAFIDGDHRVETINRDYLAVAKSTVVVFDDFYDANSAPGSELSASCGCNQVVAALSDVTVLPLADTFLNTGSIRMALKTRASIFHRWYRS